MNYLHDIPAGTAEEINVIIEIPKGSKNKYEIDKETGIIALDRAMHTSQDYPFDYGFAPRTLWDDGDALDVVVLTTYPLAPGILVRVRPVAVMDMTDGGDSDAKVIGVPVDDPRWEHVVDLKDVNKHTLKEIEHFFSTYKQIQKKKVEVGGFKDASTARADFDRSVKMYAEAHAGKRNRN
ncbi:MAG: inorganic diphosphatase [bacterium]|nr:inorganic diphosphatase [bacterium]